MRDVSTSVSRWPCPCCGHVTLPSGPGDYELCPVCSWEDDGTQLRWPMSSDGANGVSLMVAQGPHRRTSALRTMVRRRVRRPRRDEPLDPGWRPFDPAVDWTGAALSGDGWPQDPEALYYWRPTYWNGDPDRLRPERRAPVIDERQAEVRRQSGDAEMERLNQEWSDLRGQPVDVIEDRLRTRQPGLQGHPQGELMFEVTARKMSDPGWFYAHPRDALALAWRHRHAQSPLRTLKSLRRRRFTSG